MNERRIEEQLIVFAQADGGGINEDVGIRKGDANITVRQNLAAGEGIGAILGRERAALFNEVEEEALCAVQCAVDNENLCCAVEDGLGDDGAGGPAGAEDDDIGAVKGDAFFSEGGGDAVGICVVADEAAVLEANSIHRSNDLSFWGTLVAESESGFLMRDGDVCADGAEGSETTQRGCKQFWGDSESHVDGVDAEGFERRVVEAR